MTGLGSLGARLYRGEVSYDFVARRRRWYVISLVILLVSLASLGTRGLTLGVEFRGGAEFIVPSASATVDATRATVADAATTDAEPIVQELGDDRVRVQTPEVSQEKADRIQQALSDEFDVPVNDIQSQRIGPTWGGEISQKALTGLLVFLVLVALYLSLTFEWKMAVAALVALLHDLLITTGVYSLVGFEVTPATIIGLLTILGYSLYDTVVIFDKVKENTAGLAGSSRMSYSQAANLALNQTLVRSINTSVTALLPVAGLLFIGAGVLGAGTLKDLALVLFVGMAAGTYSSIFIATPLLADLKEREPAMQALAKRAAARQQRGSDEATRRRTSTRSGTSATTGARGAGGDAAGGGDESGEDADTRAPVGTSGTRTVARGAGSPGSAERNQPRRSTSRSSRSNRSSGRKKR